MLKLWRWLLERKRFAVHYGVSLIISSLALPISQSALAYSAPPYTPSYYVYATTDFYTLGQDQNTGSGTVILDFGKQYIQNGVYGVMNFYNNNTTFMSDATIQSDVQQYINGYNSDHSNYINVLVGTNNYGMNSWTTSQVEGMASHWTTMIDGLNGGAYVDLNSAMDIEGNWSGPAPVETWVNNLGVDDFNYGAPYVGPGWTTGDIYQVSWGFLYAFTFAEIYTDGDGDSTADGSINNCTEWQNISLWGATNGGAYGAIDFFGVLDESPGYPYVDDMTSGEPVINFLTQLNTNTATSQSSISWYSNI